MVLGIFCKCLNSLYFKDSLKFIFEFIPQLMGTPQKRHVVGVLVVGKTDEARVTMRAAAVMSRGESINPDRAHSAPREMVECGTSDSSGAGDDAIEA